MGAFRWLVVKSRDFAPWVGDGEKWAKSAILAHSTSGHTKMENTEGTTRNTLQGGKGEQRWAGTATPPPAHVAQSKTPCSRMGGWRCSS